MLVLALNSGSSSLKFGLYRVQQAAVDCLWAGDAEAIATDAKAVMQRIVKQLDDQHLPPPQAIGHRVVHGGPQLREHVLINEAVLAQLEAAAAYAPLHTPAALAVIRVAAQCFPGVPQVACFDTSFHARMPAVASTLPLPRELRAAGIQRYGFHGLSCESIVHQLAATLPARLLIAHLGNGASITAVKNGVSIDTSMGLTPTGGLIMGSRSGDLDPGVLVYLMREMNFDAAALEALVDHRSGLLGISGVGGDMRRLHEAAPSNADARLAIQMFCSAVAKQLAAMCTVLSGADLIVFTGGIGEHDAWVRADICARLSCLGVALDEAKNRIAGANSQSTISRDGSRCAVQVLLSQEDAQIARHTGALCQADDKAGGSSAQV